MVAASVEYVDVGHEATELMTEVAETTLLNLSYGDVESFRGRGCDVLDIEGFHSTSVNRDINDSFPSVEVNTGVDPLLDFQFEFFYFLPA